jgi:predicted metal-dependent hydrolase
MPDVTDDLAIHIIRSARRKRTISARLLNWYTLEVLVPADLSEEQLQRAVRQIKEQTLQRRSKLRSFASDAELEQRAKHLNHDLFQGALRWRSIRFVQNQHARFGSCSPAHGTIRISQRLRSVPEFVLDYVLVHELAHLLEPNHSEAFWSLVYRYDKAERARGYLLALQLEDDALEMETPLETTDEGED